MGLCKLCHLHTCIAAVVMILDPVCALFCPQSHTKRCSSVSRIPLIACLSA